MEEYILYQCHKQVHARLITKSAYCHMRGWLVPEDEDPTEEGYLVVYNKDTPDEYISWSPKRIFEEGYTEGGKEDVIIVTKKRYYELEDNDTFLCALEAAGVDNWSGYGEAQNILEEWDEEGS